ncbi:conserved virulence factor C family protein [Sinobaca sp. H24]|uniref:conserved virulence factor C family protein n=1 Tax=Sinobaca sp. H24 TaxID=2923376 RepID=UPI00207A8607|nr:conserved virulence factor C family protein [Sinobaca sp. H24]
MRITSIEPTPSPNTMKLTLDESLEAGKSHNFTLKNKEEAPEEIRKIFTIEGIKGVYHVADFMAIERHPKADWKELLPKVRNLFGEKAEVSADGGEEGSEAFGEVMIQKQMFKGIPMQLKIMAGEEEKRQGLPERFQQAAFKAQKEDDNIVLQRKWEEHGIRYGNDLDAIGEEVSEEISAVYNQERLDLLVKMALSEEENSEQYARRFKKVTLDMLDAPDWKERYAMLEQMDPKEEDIPVLEKALHDEKPSIRRLAVMYLGMIEDPVILPYLTTGLNDKSVTVRRTAGDCFSDLGDTGGIPAMIEALEDKNKLVRWRAAMFLYEVGDHSAVPALRKTAEDKEFEVALQAQMALERIEGGEEAKGSVWKQMTERMSEGK